MNPATSSRARAPLLVTLVLLLLATFAAAARAQDVGKPPDSTRHCEGKFPNPITDVCWSCLFPLTLGSTPLWKGDKPDPPNPGSPVCFCPAPPPVFVRPGLSVGFWEPVRLADVTPKAWCFVNLGGLSISPGFGYPTKSHRKVDRTSDRSGYHVHWYAYPVMYWLELLTDFLCVEKASFDIAYITELDPTWTDDQLTLLINPENLIFSNPVAVAACSVDCGASSVGLPRKEMFWCAGCQGSMFPMNGNIAGEYGQVQGSLLAVERFAFKMHRQLLAWGTSGEKALCQKYVMPIMDKRMYRFQLVNPRAHVKGKFTCPPIGRTTVPYEGGKTFPMKGEDLGFLVWRKRNCCAG